MLLHRNRASFITDVKLAKSLYTTSYDQLYAYLSQHKRHANEERIMRERYPDPLALVATIPFSLHNIQFQQLTQQSQAEFPQMDSGLAVPTFQQGDDPIECINKSMAFLSAVASRGIAITLRGNYAAGQPRVVKCYSCQGERHMARQCTQPKRPRNAAWFKEKLMLAEAQEAGQILDEEQLAFLADLGISEALVAQQTIPHNSAFQTEDLEAYDSDCDDLSSAKAVLMANLSSCDSDVLSEVLYSDTYLNNMLNQDVQEMQYSEQTHIDDFQDNEIHTMHMLTKPQVFYDDTHKQALGYQNPFNLKKAQRIQPTLYDGSVIAKEHAVISVIDDEETLILEEESRSKMLDKQNDPSSIEKKIKISPIDYSKLNKIKEYFAQSQEKDKVIRKLKDRIKSLSGKDNVENLKKDIDEIETINIELEHSVAKLLSENENLRNEREHLKLVYKDQFDSIRKTRVQSKEQSASLIAQINAKSVENSDLNAQLQEKVFAIAALKNELRKLKGKNIVDTAVSKPSATIAPGIFKLDIEPISHRLKNNRDSHEVYLEKTIENTDTLRGLELLVYVSKTCPSLMKTYEKLVAVTPINKDKKIRFVEPVISSRNSPKQTNSFKPKDSNKPLLTSTGVKPTTSTSGSKPSCNTKNNRITQPPSRNQKNKVEEHPRKVKSSLNKMNSVSEPNNNALVKHSVRNAKFESICAICNKCLFDANHYMCIIDYVNDVNVRSKYKSKRNKKRKVWKPTGKVFTKIGYSWKPTERIFTIVENRCPLTRIASTKEAPLKETTITLVIIPSSELKVYNRKPKASRSVGSSSKAKIVELKSSNTKGPKQSWGSTISDVPSSSLIDCRFGNDHIAKIIGYGDYQMGNVTISQVYYVEGLGQNLFSVGQFCDSDLEVAFHKHTCFIRDLDGVDLLKGSRGSNLYTLFMDNLLLSSPICLLSKASKTKSWLWLRRLSHLNFDYITSLAKQGLVRGLPKLKYQKDHLCSACALGKSKKHSHKPNAEDSIQEKLYLLHMDLCGPMMIQSSNPVFNLKAKRKLDLTTGINFSRE
ncbi:retrovirus-related pol polyprotein from transposon TNT 1-94 [Tanacetum coccineum]|uniref:Retrovirus-related pol polyprotein from transposon TNT 1-94 n=1 Tax=Tanacetum coccineum TaxID=301880 RepID=A0ABQ5EFN7_9ASTR